MPPVLAVYTSPGRQRYEEEEDFIISDVCGCQLIEAGTLVPSKRFAYGTTGGLAAFDSPSDLSAVGDVCKDPLPSSLRSFILTLSNLSSLRNLLRKRLEAS